MFAIYYMWITLYLLLMFGQFSDTTLLRTIFGQRSTELLGHRTDSDICFFSETGTTSRYTSQTVLLEYSICLWTFECAHSLWIFNNICQKILFAKAADKRHLLAVLTKNYDPRNLRKDSENFLENSSIIQLNVLVFALISSRNDIFY